MSLTSHDSRAHRRWSRRAAALGVLALVLGGLVSAVEAQTVTPTPTPVPTVTATPRLVRVAVAPATAKRQVGQVQNFSVAGFFSDGTQKNFTQKVIYSSSNLHAVFPPNAVGNAGLVEAVGVGTAVISVTEPTTGINSNASNESATMEVVAAPTPTATRTGVTPTKTRTPTPTPTATPTLLSLTLAPATAKRGVGQSQSFTVTGTYSDGSQKNLTQLVTYGSSNSNVAATPNEAGNKGRVVAVGPGVATITVTHPSGVSSNASGGNAELTVIVAPTPTPTRTGATPTRTISPTPTATATPILVSLALSPPTTQRGVGGFQNFTATGTFSDGNTKNLTQRADYFSSDSTVVSAPNEASNKGKVIALKVGIATISAVDTSTGIGTTASGGNATFEVIIAPTPTPTNTNVTPTRTRTPTPTPTSTPQLVALAISPTTVKKAVGQFQSFSVSGTYSDGNTKNLTQKVDYISSKPSVASAPNEAGNKGKVIAVAPGVATISAKDPVTGISTAVDNNATFTVTAAPTPTPTRTGPTSTAPSPTRTLTGSPTPTATPILTAISLAPKTAQKPVGGTQNFTATGTFSDGSSRNVTQRLAYASSDPSVAAAPNASGNRGKIVALKVGTTSISASDPSTGVSSATSDGNATLTIVQGKGTPNPRVTATPSLPIQTGNPTTACQRDIRRAARSFVDKKLKTLDRCGGAASRCIQRKPNDPGCLTAVRGRCAAALAKLADEEARLIATVIRRCATLSSAEVLGQDGLAYGDIAPSCAARFGRTLTDLTGVAQCLAAQHSCRAETLFALERPRAGELLRLVEAAPDAGACREDFGGGGLGVGDPKGVGKTLERCVQALVRGGAGLVRIRLAAIGRCIDSVFVCVEAEAGNAACLTQATQKCDREFTRVQREIGTLTVATGKRCNGLDFAVLRGPAGAYLDAVTPTCPSYGIPTVTSIADYVACLVRQHECEVADLVRFESPRADGMLGEVGRALVGGTCPQ